MFGFFKKKKNCTQEIVALVYIQNDSMKKWMKLFNAAIGKNNQQENTESILESICGKWLCLDMGICVQIRKEENGYYACLTDAGHSGDFKISYAIRTYKGMSYFIFSGYAIFIECDKDSNRMSLGGNLSFIRKVAGSIIPITQY